MEARLSPQRPSGLDRNKLRLLGLIIAAFGMLGRGILQNRVLGMTSGADLAALLESSADAMNAATAAIILWVIEGTAVPIFTLLTVDGFQRTASVKNYLFRLLLLAVVSEVPFHFALTGRLLNPSPRNPVFGLVLVVVMLYLLRYYDGNTVKHVFIRILVLFTACLWAGIGQVEYGVPMVLMAFFLYTLRQRHTMALFAASAAALVCTVGNPLFMFAPFGFLLAHFYNGEEGRASPRLLQYALYPVLLLLIGLAGVLLF
ncbi:MAG: TraX family protein [Firmicutes bacterium]|nr:TraX family protein [Bacillota bacterium]MDY6159637.1 TraX family protein [Candidatus Faecousia sp.]